MTADTKKPLFSDANGKYILYSCPWSTAGEQARWSLDRHGADYVDIDLPWGLHLWETVQINAATASSLKDVDLAFESHPLLINQKTEQFPSVTQITMFLYSQAFSGKIRLYSSAKALDEQEYFDQGLQKAARVIYLNAVLRNKEVARKYIVSANHLNTWKAINDATWNIMKWVIWVYFRLYEKSTLDNAWKEVESAAQRVEKLRDESKGSFLIGDSITAADIAFASHASLLLLPQNISLVLPTLDEMGQEYENATAAFRNSVAGRYAKNLYEKQRGEIKAKKLDKTAPSVNPDWADRPGKLRANVFLQIMHILVAIMVPVLVDIDKISTLVYWVVLALAMTRFYPGAGVLLERGKLVYKRIYLKKNEKSN